MGVKQDHLDLSYTKQQLSQLSRDKMHNLQSPGIQGLSLKYLALWCRRLSSAFHNERCALSALPNGKKYVYCELFNQTTYRKF